MIKSLKILFIFAIIFQNNRLLSFNDLSQTLIIGDSQSYGLLGRTLLSQLKRQNIETSYYSRPGSGAEWWITGDKAPQAWGSWNAPYGEIELRVPEALSTPKIAELLRKHPAKLVVIQLGGNMVHQDFEHSRRYSTQLIRQIRQTGAECLWLGPPPGDKRPQPRFRNFYNLLEEITTQESCAFMDTREIVKPAPKGGDGIHLDSMGRDGHDAIQKWSLEIFKAIETFHKTGRHPANIKKRNFKLDSFLGPSIQLPQ